MKIELILYEDGCDENEEGSDIIQAISEDGEVKLDLCSFMDDMPMPQRREVAREIVRRFNAGN